MVAVPITVPKGSVVDDVLLALHLKECNGGAAGYKSTKMDMYGSTTYMIATWFGRPIEYADNAKSVTAWKNHNMSTGLGSTVKDGDVVEWRYTCDLGYDVGGGYAVSGGDPAEG